MEKVIAVVVTYNRRALLSACIDSLRHQTRKPDTILVINNGSTDNTEEWLKTQSDISFITQNNTGGGGGFNTGISWAYKNGYSWIWCMDDDGHPKADALQVLLGVDTVQRSLLNCAVLNIENRQTFVWNTNNYKSISDVKEELIPGIAHPFNGTLLHRSIIEKVGLPKANLFLWGDETEYFFRIVSQYKIPAYTVTKSIHYHPAAAFSYKSDWDFKSSWKIYYYIRNRFHINKTRFSGSIMPYFHYLFFIMAFAGIVIVYQKTDKIKKLNFLFWPLKDAVKNNFSATPSLILNKLNEQHATTYRFLRIPPVKHLVSSMFVSSVQRRSKTATA